MLSAPHARAALGAVKLAHVPHLVIVFPKPAHRILWNNRSIGRVIPMLAEGTAVVYSDADGAFHKNLLKIGALLNLLYIYATMKEKVHDICC